MKLVWKQQQPEPERYPELEESLSKSLKLWTPTTLQGYIQQNKLPDAEIDEAVRILLSYPIRIDISKEPVLTSLLYCRPDLYPYVLHGAGASWLDRVLMSITFKMLRASFGFGRKQ